MHANAPFLYSDQQFPSTEEIEVTVVTCTHNPRRDILAQVIKSLGAQTLDRRRWEYLLIDNSSAVALRAEDWDLASCPRARIIREDALGLTYARLRGISAARGRLLVFCDDDNCLAPDYLETALRIGRGHPNLGAWGGQLLPRFETDPPEWIAQCWGFLALRRVTGERWGNVPTVAEILPYGAGLCVRREFAQRYAEEVRESTLRQQLDRRGARLTSCGDTDLCYTVCGSGAGIGVFASLELTHLISSFRLTESYILGVAEGTGYSDYILSLLYSYKKKSASSLYLGKVFDLFKFRRLSGIERRCRECYRAGFRRAQREVLRSVGTPVVTG